MPQHAIQKPWPNRSAQWRPADEAPTVGFQLSTSCYSDTNQTFRPARVFFLRLRQSINNSGLYVASPTQDCSLGDIRTERWGLYHSNLSGGHKRWLCLAGKPIILKFLRIAIGGLLLVILVWIWISEELPKSSNMWPFTVIYQNPGLTTAWNNSCASLHKQFETWFEIIAPDNLCKKVAQTVLVMLYVAGYFL